MPIEARVALICAKYAPFGVIPLPVPVLFPDVPIPVDRIPAHEGTDLDYLRKLAEDVGYAFYVEPGPLPATNIAYFGPHIKIGVPQPALNLDMDAHTNVASLNFSFDPTKGKLPVMFAQNALTRAPIPIPVPNVNPLQPPLGLLPAPIANIEMLHDTRHERTQGRAAGYREAPAGGVRETRGGSGQTPGLRACCGVLRGADGLLSARTSGQCAGGGACRAPTRLTACAQTSAG